MYNYDYRGVVHLHSTYSDGHGSVEEINRQGWLGFIAHPDHEGTKRFDIPSYKWQDWNVNNFTGIGLWDLMTDWQEKLDKDNITVEVYTEFAKHLSGPKDITL